VGRHGNTRLSALKRAGERATVLVAIRVRLILMPPFSRGECLLPRPRAVPMERLPECSAIAIPAGLVKMHTSDSRRLSV
jgi:hypothetical protein